jgi:hypothetical protein
VLTLQGAPYVKSLFVGVFAAYLMVVQVRVVAGPLLMLRERLQRRAEGSGRGRAA